MNQSQKHKKAVKSSHETALHHKVSGKYPVLDGIFGGLERHHELMTIHLISIYKDTVVQGGGALPILHPMGNYSGPPMNRTNAANTPYICIGLPYCTLNNHRLYVCTMLYVLTEQIHRIIFPTHLYTYISHNIHFKTTLQ